ncbi:MAG: ATP-binding protein [Gammaproteobacteria bacterium]
MEELKHKLDYIIKNVPGYVFWKDENSVLRGCNNNFAKQVGLDKPEDIVGKTDFELPWTKEQTEAFIQDDRAVIKTGKAKINIEEPQRQANGCDAFLLTSKVPTYDMEGKIDGILGIYVDITEIKETEKKLKKAKEQAEEANKIKNQFIADMEHDLRTPCSGIAEMTKLLEMSETDPEKKEILSQVANASGRLLNILNGILAFSEIEAGQYPIVNKEIDIRKIFNDILVIGTPSAKTKGLELIHSCSSDVPNIIISDEHRISRIMLNLISNAIKFTNKGHVEITINLDKKNSNKGEQNKQEAVIKITVSDTGIGIPKDKQNLIYERFVKIAPANRGEFTGTGLGLSIVKQFVDDLNGRIEIKSKLGKGSAFICTLPVKISSQKQRLETKDATAKSLPNNMLQQKLNVLLVEDDTLAQMVALTILQKDFNIDVAETGKEAVKLVSSKKYDIILMDIGLPDIDGYEVTKRIRNLKKSRNKDSIIIGLTAHSAKAVKGKCVKSGMSECLTKPLDAQKMYCIIQTHISSDVILIPVTKITEKTKKDEEKHTTNLSIIDLGLGAQRVGGDKNMARKMLSMLVDDLSKGMKTIESFFKAKDFKEMGKLVHKLHGGLCYCGTSQLTKATNNLEIVLKTGDGDRISQKYNIFRQKAEETLQEFEENYRKKL